MLPPGRLRDTWKGRATWGKDDRGKAPLVLSGGTASAEALKIRMLRASQAKRRTITHKHRMRTQREVN